MSDDKGYVIVFSIGGRDGSSRRKAKVMNKPNNKKYRYDFSTFNIYDLLACIHSHTIDNDTIDNNPHLRALKDVHYDIVIRAMEEEGIEYEPDPEPDEWKHILADIFNELRAEGVNPNNPEDFSGEE